MRRREREERGLARWAWCRFAWAVVLGAVEERESQPGGSP